MKHNKLTRWAALILAAALTLSLTACGGAGGSSSAGSASASQSAPASAITLTDQAGRQVELDAPADTLVSCYYVTTYATMALGISDRVVGLEKKADTRPIYAMAAPDLLEKEQVGTMKELDLEAVAALEPDLVVMPKKLMDYAAPLEELGIPVLVVNPESHEALTGMLELLGQACGVEDRAQALTDYYEEQLARVAQLVDGLERPTVYMGGNSSYLTAAPGDMYQSSLIETAGGVNAAADLTGGYWTEVSYESILAMAPQDILGDPQLAAVPAVQSGAVYEMPSGIEEWDSPIPSGILGTLWMTSVLHGDAYPFDTFTADVQDFYKTFYGFEIDPALITK